MIIGMVQSIRREGALWIFSQETRQELREQGLEGISRFK